MRVFYVNYHDKSSLLGLARGVRFSFLDAFLTDISRAKVSYPQKSRVIHRVINRFSSGLSPSSL
jgi:hypothetical protein